MMHPVHDFTSPFMMDERSSHVRQQKLSERHNSFKGNEGIDPRIESDQAIHLPYNIKDELQAPGLYLDMYPYIDSLQIYGMPKLEHPSGDVLTYSQTNGGQNRYAASVSTVDQSEYLMKNHGYDIPDTNEVKSRSSATTRSTPSLGSECSPLAPPRNQSISNMGNEHYYLNPNFSNSNRCEISTPTAIGNPYNMTGYSYSEPSQPSNRFGDGYNQTFVDSSRDMEMRLPEYWCQPWNNTSQMEYKTGVGRKEMTDTMPRKHPLMQGSGYNIIPDQYPRSTLYNVNDGIDRSYICEAAPNIGYSFPPEETGYYNPSEHYTRHQGNDVLDSTIHDVGILHHGAMRDPRSVCIQPIYDGSYCQASKNDNYYVASPSHNSGRSANTKDQDLEDNNEASMEAQDGMLSEVSLDALKTMNRNEIDFLRMSDSLWQTLRSTGMFKLGNKGRAILKSKISKQLKMNPKLRMRALCISGVRRATTRQLFQLAQICGIKSHFK